MLSSAGYFRRFANLAGCCLLSTTLALIASPGNRACAATPIYTVLQFDARHDNLLMVWRDPRGQPYRRLASLAQSLKAQGLTLKYAMNAGMFHADLSPVGLFISAARQERPLNLQTGSGNFFLQPNGVLLLARSGPKILRSDEFPSLREPVYFATQSGPLLLRQGRMHPAFDRFSRSRQIRNAVAIGQGRVYFVISNQPVSFYELASYLRDSLQSTEALYLDGAVSSLYSPPLQRDDNRAELGPMLAVLAKP